MFAAWTAIKHLVLAAGPAAPRVEDRLDLAAAVRVRSQLQ